MKSQPGIIRTFLAKLFSKSFEERRLLNRRRARPDVDGIRPAWVRTPMPSGGWKSAATKPAPE
ncbi:hypothetical protein CXP35_03045 [Komagataeibacter xylinus]|nr:hypothetical protein CXP35_03045 [Komagataeibacter xylinus]